MIALSIPLIQQILLESDPFWLWQFLGRLHPMIVHFPISLLLVAAVLEIISIKQFSSRWRSTIELMLWTGAISAVASAGMGYLLMVQDGYEGAGVDLHQKLGIATAVLSLVALGLHTLEQRQPIRSRIIAYRSTLILSAIALVFTGHYGAMLTHGPDYLTEVLPGASAPPANTAADLNIDLAIYEQDTSAISEQAKLKLLTGVRTVFAHTCYRCHSSDKIKGGLRLDDRKLVFKGGENGPVITAGDPENSELIRRISLPKGHDDVMPNKGDLLTPAQIKMISIWVQNGAWWPENAEDLKIFRNAPLAPRYPEWPADTSRFDNKIDVWVDQYFSSKNLSWDEPVDDRTYLRRIYLDIVGLNPSSEEIHQFVEDPHPEKRQKWARELLDQEESYALHWLTFWNDILRNDYTGTGYITKGRYGITEWLFKSLVDNKPYQDMARELLSPDESSKGFIAGIQWRGVVNASQRTEMQAAQNVAQVMLGLNLKCASCHDSFISDWKLKDAYGFANIFSEVTMEINRCDKPTGEMAETRLLWKELGTIDSTASRENRLEEMATKLTDTNNGRLYRTMVNRIWAQLMGRGIVEPVDEMDQLPWSQDLLDWLAVNFVGNGFDLKNLIYTIVTSRAYQLPAIPVDNNLALREEGYTFRGPVLRKITAEQFSDMVSSNFGSLFTSKEMKFNPENRDTNFIRASQVANNAFLTALGRPNREVVVTNRNDQPNLIQALELTNGTRLTQALAQGAEQWKNTYNEPEDLIDHTYMNLLGRLPLSDEKDVALQALGPSPDTNIIQDYFWVMVLHPEVQFIK
ncbi:DUF1549 domain-containing protein [Membranicola marinus]|uniref:DUF1549 domain-containing protein n=1 Tax=Membranihabitans marinus TaxID=1227546 RepID=A0A953LCK2_9BACT|nr:DUF1549 domain-containing protein [Membranihabitans marinus]MBY5959591.1 DUF1549 domain-containing protein [Membranihabitans marinus]